LAISADQLTNLSLVGERKIVEDGVVRHFYRIHKKGRDSQGISTSRYLPAEITETITVGTAQMADNIHVVAQQVAIADVAQQTTTQPNVQINSDSTAQTDLAVDMSIDSTLNSGANQGDTSLVVNQDIDTTLINSEQAVAELDATPVNQTEPIETTNIDK